MARKNNRDNGKYISIYHDPYVSIHGYLRNGELEITSAVYGDWDSESHYSFDRENTKKLFEHVSMDALVKVCREQGTSGLIDLAAKYDIHYNVCTI